MRLKSREVSVETPVLASLQVFVQLSRGSALRDRLRTCKPVKAGVATMKSAFFTGLHQTGGRNRARVHVCTCTRACVCVFTALITRSNLHGIARTLLLLLTASDPLEGLFAENVLFPREEKTSQQHNCSKCAPKKNIEKSEISE